MPTFCPTCSMNVETDLDQSQGRRRWRCANCTTVLKDEASATGPASMPPPRTASGNEVLGRIGVAKVAASQVAKPKAAPPPIQVKAKPNPTDMKNVPVWQQGGGLDFDDSDDDTQVEIETGGPSPARRSAPGGGMEFGDGLDLGGDEEPLELATPPAKGRSAAPAKPTPGPAVPDIGGGLDFSASDEEPLDLATPPPKNGRGAPAAKPTPRPAAVPDFGDGIDFSGDEEPLELATASKGAAPKASAAVPDFGADLDFGNEGALLGLQQPQKSAAPKSRAMLGDDEEAAFAPSRTFVGRIPTREEPNAARAPQKPPVSPKALAALAAVQAQKVPAPSPTPPAPALPPFGTVLLCDAAEPLRQNLKAALEGGRVCTRVTTCATGEELLQQITELLLARTPPELVVLDVDMPLIGGMQLALALRPVERALKAAPTPLLFFTSRTCDDTLKRVLEYCKPARYLSKGPDPAPQRVAARLAQVLASLRQG